MVTVHRYEAETLKIGLFVGQHNPTGGPQDLKRSYFYNAMTWTYDLAHTATQFPWTRFYPVLSWGQDSPQKTLNNMCRYFELSLQSGRGAPRMGCVEIRDKTQLSRVTSTPCPRATLPQMSTVLRLRTPCLKQMRVSYYTCLSLPARR